MEQTPAASSLPGKDGFKRDRLEVLMEAARRAGSYLDGLEARPVFPMAAALDGRAAFDAPLPEEPQDALQTLALLDDAGSPAAVGSA